VTGPREILDWPADDDGQAAIRVTVTGLPRTTWDRLIDAHQPEAGAGGAWNPDTFLPALVAACTGLPETVAGQYADDTEIGPELVDACLRLSAPQPWTWARRRLDTDPLLAVELGYCTRAGIPHSVFASWQGRDRDLALAFAEWDGDRCPGCGVPGCDMGAPDAWRPAARECAHCRSLRDYEAAMPDGRRGWTHPRLLPAAGGDG
jgi:hypothetical protein